jgi:Fe-S-cluster containining protein
MPFKDFFRKWLAVDWWVGESAGQETFVIAPAVMRAVPGEEYPTVPTGVCIFFVNSRCLIHEVKPFECQMFWHGDSDAQSRHEQVANAWKDHQEYIHKILGRKPVVPEPSLEDIYGLMAGLL